MLRALATLVLGATAMVATHAAEIAPADPYAAAGAFVVLSYHEVRDDVRDYPDPYAVDTAALVRQFAWLRGNGYTPVSLDAIVAARAGGKPLPAKAVLLTFDDAYLSFYTRVYPLLQEFRYPALLAVVGKWIDSPPDAQSLYGEKGGVAAASFPTWRQLREMADSGLVELASHTFDLHRGIIANPQANLQPAAAARLYDPATGAYEDDTSWRARVSADLAAGAAIIERETGRRPRAIVWPYGSYNNELLRMAGEWGMTVGITLDDGPNTPDVPLTAVRRTLVEHNPALAEFIVEVRGPRYPQPVRAVQVSLDEVYSTDPAQQERNLSALLDRVLVLQPTHVYLQATADSDGDGVADMAYFPNRHLPLRADLFNRAAWQLASRVDVKVFAVMPVEAIRLAPANLAEVYEDLARHASFDGLVFDDKSPPEASEDARSLELTRELAARARVFRAPLQTVRTLGIELLPGAAPRQAQRYAAYAAAYDYVALVMTPARPAAPVAALLAGVGLTPDYPTSRSKVLFMLRNSASPAGAAMRDPLAAQMRSLQLGGALNFGYVPADFLHDDPPLAAIAPVFSLRVNPLQATKEK